MAARWGKAVRRWAAAVLALATSCLAGNAHAILESRGPDMVYDTVLDITWTRQAGDGFLRNWADANAWAAGLSFGGFDDWRLPYASVAAGASPTTTVVDCATATEAECRDNEMGYMFYYNLDGDPADNKTGTQTAVGDEQLIGIQPGYWSATEAFSGLFAWSFWFLGGSQQVDGEANVAGGGFNFAWAVRAGDVAAVPEPASLLLFGLGALGLGWSRRSGRRR